MASNNGRTQSQEAEVRLERSFEEADALDLALALAYGADNAGLLHLLGHVLRVVAPHGGQWLDADAASTEVARGIVHVLRRLRAPDDGHIGMDGSVERRLDRLIYDSLGAGENENSARGRWAAEQRQRFGSEIGNRLLRIHRAISPAMEAENARIAASWDRAIAKHNAKIDAEIEDEVQCILRAIEALPALNSMPSPDYAAVRGFIAAKIGGLQVDEARRAELLDLLAKAAPQGDEPAE